MDQPAPRTICCCLAAGKRLRDETACLAKTSAAVGGAFSKNASCIWRKPALEWRVSLMSFLELQVKE